MKGPGPTLCRTQLVPASFAVDPPLTKAEPFEGGFIASENIFRKVCKNMEEERTEGARRSEMQEVFHDTAVTAWKGL